STNSETPPLQCVLTGNWTNDLGSNMTIKYVNEDGDFNGTYVTAVKDTPNNVTNSMLLGSL
ncbi:AVR1 protein, partial [Bucorvus abyssinicus]|nr:AVR1 protein [Bucorvus abyssinicus]